MPKAQPSPPPLPIWQNAVDDGNVFHRATAFVMADTRQTDAFQVRSRLRNVLRAMVVAGVIAAVITFTVLKYSTDGSIRSSTTTTRVTDYSTLSDGQIEVASCPCRNDTLAFSKFTTYSSHLNEAAEAREQFCQNFLNPADVLAAATAAAPASAFAPAPLAAPAANVAPAPLAAPLDADVQAVAPAPTSALIAQIQQDDPETGAGAGELVRPVAPAIVATVDAYNDSSFNSPISVAAYVCFRTVSDVLVALNPDPITHSVVGDNLHQVALLSHRQTNASVTSFVGDKLLSHLLDSVAQLGLEEVLLARKRANFTAEDNVNYDESTVTALNDALTELDLEQPLLSDTYEQIVGASLRGFPEQLLHQIQSNLTVNWADYAQACDPLYCDYTEVKSTWARITEFLSLVGGLWTTFLGIGLAVWFAIDQVIPSG